MTYPFDLIYKQSLIVITTGHSFIPIRSNLLIVN